MNQLLQKIEEFQEYGDRLISLRENSQSKSLTDYQKRILHPQTDKLPFLGLKLSPQLDQTLVLRSSNLIGIARLALGKDAVTVQVVPKVGNACFFKMLQHANQEPSVGETPTLVGLDTGSPADFFLEYFATQVQRFLRRQPHRDYRFMNDLDSPRLKGRLLVKEYVSRSLPLSKVHIIPHRFIDYTVDNVENQIIAYAVHLALQISSVIPSKRQHDLQQRLRECLRLLPGVTIRRISKSDLTALRYTHLNERFRGIHRLCEVVIYNSSIGLPSAKRIPFHAFAIDMPRLFEQYVAAVFSKAYRQDFECSKSRLTFPLDAVDKDIELDGVLRHRGLCLVIESKYKILGEEDEDVDSFDLSGARIRSHDLYQALAYATHIELRAQVVILIYPSWLSARSPVCVFDPITKLGWRPEGREGIPIFLVALDLSQPFNSVVDAMKQATGKIVDSLAA